MAFWNRFFGINNGAESQPAKELKVSADSSRYGFVDIEVGVHDKRIHDIGAIRWDGAVFHSANRQELMSFLGNVDFICWHNIINHDAKYQFANNYLYEPGGNTPLAQLSQKMQGELQGWAEKGYRVDSAIIRFIVAWRPKDAPPSEQDHAVLLVDLGLKK